jgi:TolB protein
MLRYVFIFFIMLLSSFVFAQEKVFIDVGQAQVRKSLLALPVLQNLGTDNSPTAERLGQELFQIIRNDLDVSGLFAFIKPEAFLEDPSKVGLRPAPNFPNGFNFKTWNEIGTEFLVRGGFQIVNDTINLEIYTYYVPQAKLVIGSKYSGSRAQLRKIAHTFAHEFVRALTGRDSFFLNRIVVAIDDGPRSFRDIYLMDWDGGNEQKITDHKSIAISPAWSRDGKKIAYTAFINRRIGNGPMTKNADLLMYEVDTKKRWIISSRTGMNSGAEFFPDSNNLFLTLSQGGTADIYKMSGDGKNLDQFTFGPGKAMNVEPAISPDGTKVAFSSDRSGRPMIYVTGIKGGTVTRLTFAGHYNATPSWSPDGKKIVFAGFDKEKSNFDVFIMNADGSNLERLTSAKKPNGRWANNEDPSFSPDGRHVLFVSDRTGNKQLHIVATDGSNERRITFDKRHYSKPKWGPQSR